MEASMGTVNKRVLPDRIIRMCGITCNVTEKRVWAGDQRVHHGAVGAMAAALGLVGLATHLSRTSACLKAVLLGIFLMSHDRKDLDRWFMPGRQS